MSGDFTGRVAMVTGAAGGIGAASAVAFARRGAAVLVCDLLEEGGQATVERIVAEGGTASFVRTDVADADSVEAAVATAVQRYGRLDAAHNNAGIFRAAPLVELDLDDWRTVIDVNVTGVFLCVQAQLRRMLAAGSGAIVNTASVWSFAGSAGQAAYTASKHAVVGLTKTAALDHGGRGIRINAVAPGPIATGMTASVPDEIMRPVIARTVEDRFGTPEEIAAGVVWLCSDDASYVNGSVLTIDGGWLA